MPNLFTEDTYEQAIIELFENMGYDHIYAPDLDRDYSSPLLDNELRSSLVRINRGLPVEAIGEALAKLKDFDTGSLLQKNIIFMDYLQNGITVKFFVKGEEQSSIIRLIDYQNVKNNSFYVVNQFTFLENGNNRRPDVILFINGLPLALMELKSPAKDEVGAENAFHQIRNYMKDIPSIFYYNAICVISDLSTNKAGTITSGLDRFMEWKTKDGNYEDTLTAYNSEMSDRPFREKMNMPGGFKESALRLNKYIVLLNEWNEKHIQERANMLAKKAESIWPYPSLTNVELAPYQEEKKTAQKYSLETYDINAFTKMLFTSLDKRIMNLSPDVKREYKKLYVAYKLDTNFVDIVFQKQRLRISINMKFTEVNDPNGICKDITDLGRWGNGDVELFMEHQDELEQIMEIVKQSFDAQTE